MLVKGFEVPDLLHPDLPSAVSWFPLPPGWYVLGALCLLALMFMLTARLARFRRNRWRREARGAMKPQNVDNWIILIKRILLVHHPRRVVSQWQTPAALLAHTTLDADLRAMLCQRYCQPDNQLDDAMHQRLMQQVRRWLESLPNV